MGSLGASMCSSCLGKVPQGRKAQLLAKGDNVGALTLALKLGSSQPILNGLGAELALTLEVFDMDEVLTAHIPGKLNVKADTLSRVETPGGPANVPAEFAKSKERKLPARDDAYFMAWDFSVRK